MAAMRSIRFPLPRLPGPYTTFAALYDVLSLEWPIYRTRRVAGIGRARAAARRPRARPGLRKRPEPPSPAATDRPGLRPGRPDTRVDEGTALIRRCSGRCQRDDEPEWLRPQTG
jgi:hypothetical protein